MDAIETCAQHPRSKRARKKPAKKANHKGVLGKGDIEAAVEKECGIFKRKLNSFIKRQLCAYRGRADKARSACDGLRRSRIGKKDKPAVQATQVAE